MNFPKSLNYFSAYSNCIIEIISPANLLLASAFSYDIFICLILIWTTNGQLGYNKLHRITLDIFAVMCCIVRFCAIFSEICNVIKQLLYNSIFSRKTQERK